MTLRGILAVQEAFNRSGRGKGQPILLDFVEQDAPARAHSLELNMPLHVYSSFLHSPESRSLIYWRMPGLSYRPFECGATNVRRQNFCAINHCVNSQQRKRFHASINQKGGYTPFEANNTNTCPTSQNAELCSGGGAIQKRICCNFVLEKKANSPDTIRFSGCIRKIRMDGNCQFWLKDTR